ncbi:hypothetical protein [Pantoea sp. ACRSB]|uniref:hypothetical protein n=1 Tax=Pantoea sp. ACRSB TaxID=2918207 RepID=UPI002892E0F2|nr:hypothetical protein [Pantoea sp. ACRSB]MCG7387989.1 hypothetical protein [Pantoea sp. ACRSB]
MAPSLSLLIDTPLAGAANPLQKVSVAKESGSLSLKIKKAVNSLLSRLFKVLASVNIKRRGWE